MRDGKCDLRNKQLKLKLAAGPAHKRIQKRHALIWVVKKAFIVVRIRVQHWATKLSAQAELQLHKATVPNVEVLEVQLSSRLEFETSEVVSIITPKLNEVEVVKSTIGTLHTIYYILKPEGFLGMYKKVSRLNQVNKDRNFKECIPMPNVL